MKSTDFYKHPEHGALATLALGKVQTREAWLRSYLDGTSGFSSIDDLIASVHPTLLNRSEERVIRSARSSVRVKPLEALAGLVGGLLSIAFFGGFWLVSIAMPVWFVWKIVLGG